MPNKSKLRTSKKKKSVGSEFKPQYHKHKKKNKQKKKQKKGTEKEDKRPPL
jgi:hypothetical protein